VTVCEEWGAWAASLTAAALPDGVAERVAAARASVKPPAEEPASRPPLQ